MRTQHFLLTVFFSLWLPFVQAQNSLWSIAPDFFSLSEAPPNQPLPTPAEFPGLPMIDNDDLYYSGDPATHTHNAMIDANGNLLFFVVDGRVYDKHGYLIVQQSFQGFQDPNDGHAKGNSEVVIVPDPADCRRFYIFSSTQGTEQNTPIFTHIDLSLTNPLFYPIAELTGAPIIFSNSENSLPLSSLGWPNHQSGPGDGTHFDTHFAASKRMTDNSHWLFVVTYSRISKFKIDENGVSYIPEIIELDNILNNLPFATGTLNGRSEIEVFEMSNGHFKVALSLTAGPINLGPGANSRAVVIVELDENGEYVPNSVLTHHLAEPQGTSTEPRVKGLEFSKNGTYLYFTHHITPSNPNPVQYINTQTGNVSTLNVPNSANYQYSQIELSTDNKLYFAHAGGLATLEDSENPSSAWDAAAVTFTYQVSDVGYPEQTHNHVYLVPDQIDGMDYSQFFNSEECCRDLPQYDHVVYQATQSATWEPGFGSNSLINSASDVVRINEELRIPAGVHIIIKNMRFEFFENARCIIEAGASLTLDGTTFTVGPCDALMWHGIEVWGNPTLPQYPASNQGLLILKNKSVVEHAKIGAIMAKKTFNMFGGIGFSTSHEGGFVHSFNSTFRNNEKDVVIKGYINSLAPNRCRFDKTLFLTDGLLNHPNIFPVYHAELEKVNGVLFTNCSFLNIATFEEHPILKRGTGINSSYATFSVVGNNQAFGGDLEEPHQSFYQLYRGILSLGNVNHPFTASKMDFQMNQQGIAVIGSCFENIIFNNFTVPENTGNYIDYPFGCYLIGSYLFTLEENNFNSEDSEWNINYGLIVANSSKTFAFDPTSDDVTYNDSQPENEVYRNNFKDFKYGMTVLGDNRGQDDQAGLQARCNVFENCETDFFLADDNVFGAPAWRDDQGFQDSPNTIVNLTHNRFSHSSFDCNGLVRDFRISENYGVESNGTGGSNYFDYKCLNDPFTSPQDCNDTQITIVHFEMNLGITLDYATHCPSNFGSPGPIGPIKLQLAEARSNLETAIGLYEITVDGGEKEDILQALAAAHSYESQFLRNMLLERYPLSREVLMAALARASSFDPWHLTQVLVPNARLSTDIMNFLEDNEVLSPFFMQFIYDANATGNNSLRDILKSEISYRSYDKSRIERKINRHYLDVDSLDVTEWNDFINEQAADYYLMYRIDENLQMGNVTKAIELKDSLTAQHPDMFNWLDFRFDLATADSVDATHINTAWNFYNESQAVLADALAWLFVHGEIDSLPKPPVHVGEPRSLSSSKPSKPTTKRNFLEAWPNPATDRVMLTYPNEADGMGIIQIFNQQGVLVHQVAAQGRGIAEINTTQWSPGIYIALLKVEGKVFDDVKISVVR